MLFYKVRELIMQGINITNIPLKVTYYARVSTEKDAQLNSLDNQITYFEEYIKSNSNWFYIPGYIDEGISGSSVKNRTSFLRMIEDAKNNFFDLIITKEVSRFSRSLIDSIKYTQILMQSNVGVYFLTNNINTYDINAEFILNMMGSVAQEEVKRLSERVKFGHENAIKKGTVLGSMITGYDKKDGKLQLNSDSEMIKTLFELYITEKYGLSKIGYILYNLGYSNRNGKIYDKSSLKRMIRNPKYKGFYCARTSRVIDYKTKKRIFYKSHEWINYKDNNIPSIVSEDTWNLANKLLDKRTTKNKNISAKTLYPYSSKIFCLEHHKYQRLTGSRNYNNPRWACDLYLKEGLKGCKSPIILEHDLDEIMLSIYKEFNTNKIVLELLELYKNITLKDNTLELNFLKSKKNKLLDLYLNNLISKDELNNKIINLDNQIKDKNSNIELNNIKDNINFDLNLITNLLDRIIVDNKTRKDIRLDIYFKNKLYKKKHFYESKHHTKNYKPNTYTYNVYL